MAASLEVLTRGFSPFIRHQQLRCFGVSGRQQSVDLKSKKAKGGAGVGVKLKSLLCNHLNM